MSITESVPTADCYSVSTLTTPDNPTLRKVMYRVFCDAMGLRVSERRFQLRLFNRQVVEASGKLRELTLQGAPRRYGALSAALLDRIEYELRTISDLGFADYFLVVHDLLQFAKRDNFRHAGRDSAADSMVAYSLDITKVGSFHRNLRFERFINPEGAFNAKKSKIESTFALSPSASRGDH